MASTNTQKSKKRRKSSAYGIELGEKRSKTHRRQDGSRLPAWERFMLAVGLGFLAYLIRRAGNALLEVFSSPLVLSVPFSILLLLTSTDFLIITAVNDSLDNLFFDQLGIMIADARRDDAELLKRQVLLYFYYFVLFLSAIHWRRVFEYFKQWPHLLLLFVCLLIGAMFSIEPVKVLTNTALIVIGYLTAILFAIANADRRRYSMFYLAVFLPLFVLHIASFAVFFLYDVDLVDFLFSSKRYGGLAGNPNSLGASVVLGYWAAICLVLSSASRFSIRLLAGLSIPLFILHMFMSGSGTALVAVCLVTIVLFWLRVLVAFKPVVRQALNAGVAVLLIIIMMAIVISTTPAELYLTFTDSLGKDTSLTGRTELWDVARAAIEMKPYFGWGFDSHASVMAEGAFDIEFNHYHNGYLDTLVAGGGVVLTIVLYNFVRFARAFFVSFRKDPAAFPLIVPLIMLLFLNLSEYSLLRPNSQIWSIYVVAFVMLTFQQRDKLFSRIAPRSDTRQSRSRKRQLRWA